MGPIAAGLPRGSFQLKRSAELRLVVCRGVEECAQAVAAAGVAEFAQRLGFNLADAFARNGEVLADLFQSVLAAILQAEAHFDDLLFAWRQRFQDFRGLLAEVEIDDGLRRRDDAAVDDEIAEMRLFLFAHWSFERDGLLSDAQDFADLTDGQIHFYR